ncbi:unnamed protein product [Triticum turgidum subsp. durum]|uniref:SnTox1 sensitivity protein n=1 Tax=Triticum turgidum subsp. durum TaxID=4567 RepID=A0A9R1B6M4_TRITD|nr:unnamed protein product [Triticum turgidum subsp. durum]
MATPSSHFQSQPQHLLLVLPVPVILVLIFAMAAEAQGGCRHKCGDIDIPFPFGIGVGPGCFHDGFEVLCNESSVPPRAFLAGGKYVRQQHSSPSGDIESSWLVELASLSVATGEARVFAPVSYHCNTQDNGVVSMAPYMELLGTRFAASTTRNVLMGLGWSADTRLSFMSTPEMLFACLAFDIELDRGDGSCSGSCCQATLARYGKSLRWTVKFLSDNTINMPRLPCSYGMVVEKSWYTYSMADLEGYKVLLNRFPQGVRMVLNFTAGDGLCPAKGQPPPQDYACLSSNSFCANATYGYTPGYICKCLDGYAGNPYIPNGCPDIDECSLLQNPCSNGGVCTNKLGGYDCPCKFGMKDDGRGGTCTDIFPLAAKAAVGAIGGVLLVVIISFLVILRKEKKKVNELYKRNGGPTLEKANVIKLFKKDELKPILKNSNLIGKGCFGEVYKGLLENKLVAVKKPINGSVLESDQFANEVIIQSQVIHKNIVRLIGCCLEVDAPMLVYEFISQGSLHDILHNNNNKVALNLDARLSIAAHSADGLAYMHSKTNIRILHGDVKPANILLDDNFIPKISDFGISRLIAREKEHTASIIGDMNYMDPVYLQEGLLTEKSDVYSFGVVILELISRRRAMHSDNNKLVKNFLEAHKKQNKATEFFDKEIAITEDLELLDSLAGMAVECLSLDVDQRPTMMEVAERLLILGRSRKV